jgi:hypothetical protein
LVSRNTAEYGPEPPKNITTRTCDELTTVSAAGGTGNLLPSTKRLAVRPLWKFDPSTVNVIVWFALTERGATEVIVGDAAAIEVEFTPTLEWTGAVATAAASENTLKRCSRRYSTSSGRVAGWSVRWFASVAVIRFSAIARPILAFSRK